MPRSATMEHNPRQMQRTRATCLSTGRLGSQTGRWDGQASTHLIGEAEQGAGNSSVRGRQGSWACDLTGWSGSRRAGAILRHRISSKAQRKDGE